MSQGNRAMMLGDVLKRSTEMVVLQADRTYHEVTVKMWGKGVVQRGTITGAEVASPRRFIARSGQFILSRIDARHGALGVVPSKLDGAIVSSDFPVFTPDPEYLDANYLGWLSRSAGFVDLCRRASEGTTNRVRLQEERFLSFCVDLPKLSEQKWIVEHIERLVTQVNEAKSLRAQAVREADAFVISSHLSLSGGRTRRLGEIMLLDEEAVSIEADGSYPQVGVRSFGKGLFSKAALLGTQTTYRAFNRLYPGALVLSQVKGWEGAVAICDESLTGWFVSPEYRTFRCIDGEASPRYLAQIVSTEWFWSRLAHATRGVGARRERTRPEQFLELEFPMPELEKQRVGELVLAEVNALKKMQAETTTDLETMVPAVIDSVFGKKL